MPWVEHPMTQSAKKGRFYAPVRDPCRFYRENYPEHDAGIYLVYQEPCSRQRLQHMEILQISDILADLTFSYYSILRF